MISWLKNWYRFLNPKFQSIHLDYPVDVKPRFTPAKGPNEQLQEIISRGDDHYQSFLNKVLDYQDNFAQWTNTNESSDPLMPSWNNEYLPALDMMALYVMMSELKPKTYVEIGSGHSTKVCHQAIKDQSLSTSIVSIDPAPRAMINNLADEVYRKKLEDSNVEEIVSRLFPGDILFIDNSHRILPNSDASIVFTEILPRLQKGVILHLHDIYLPYDYPQFMCDRYYSEQYGLAIAILANPERYKTILPAFYVSERPELAKIIDTLWTLPQIIDGERHGGSYWIEIGT